MGGISDYEVFQETDRGEVPGRYHYVPRNTLGPSLCGISQVDHRVHLRFISLLLPVNLAPGQGFDSLDDGEKCIRCRLRISRLAR